MDSTCSTREVIPAAPRPESRRDGSGVRGDGCRLGDALLDSPAGQYSFLQGGTATLTPEESDTVTYGIILQPRFLPKLAMSIDSSTSTSPTWSRRSGRATRGKRATATRDADACSRIHRDPATGALWIGDGNVEDLNLNIGGLSTTGYDMSVTYGGVELGRFGALDFNLTATYLDELIEDPGGGFVPYDCAGQYTDECDTPSPKWRHHFRTGWIALERGRLADLALLRQRGAVPW